MELDFKKKSSKLFLDLLNTKSKRPLLAEEVAFSDTTDITPVGESSNLTTTLVSTTDVNEKLTGVSTVTYKRVGLEALFEPVAESMVISEDKATAQGVLDELNERFNLGLSDEDFDIDGFVMEDYVITLKAKADGLVYVGDLVVRVEPDILTLEYLLGDGMLDGFSPPVLELEPESWEVLNDVTFKYNDNNKLPKGNVDATNYVTSSDGRLDVGVRWGKAVVVHTPVNYTYTVPAGTPNYQSAYAAFGVPEGSGKPTDLYDLSFELYSSINGASLSGKINLVDGVPVAEGISEAYSRSGVANDAGNVISIGFSSVTFPPAIIGSGTQTAPPPGTYTIKITAIPKTGGKPPIEFITTLIML